MRFPPTPEGIRQASDALRAGELVAFPTETVYGLGARADSSEAVRAIYTAKSRPAENPSIVHAADMEAAFALASTVSPDARALAERFWPGPLTLVLDAQDGKVAPEVTAGGATVAVRVPAHELAQALLRSVGLPLAAPSANRSTGISPTTAEHVEKSLGKDIRILDGGPTGFGIESTIVDATVSPLVVLRRGSVTLAEIAEIASVVDRGDDLSIVGTAARAPGSQARHYAPTVPLSVVELVSLEADAEAGLIHSEAAPIGTLEFARTMALPEDPAGFARCLYAALHALEDSGVKRIVVVAVPDAPEWAAVRDRLERASRLGPS